MALNLKLRAKINITNSSMKTFGENFTFFYFMSQDEPTLIVNDKCDFEIQLLHPTSCVPKCGLKVYDHIIDLRSLRKVYHIHDELGNFSIGFCTNNQECHESNSVSCLITESGTLPLSGALESLQYYDDSNTIKLRGKFKGRIRNGKGLSWFSMCITFLF